MVSNPRATAVFALLALSAAAAHAQPTAEAAGMSVSGVVCSNLTTGQQVISPTSGATWDCAGLGLLVNPGDRLQVGARGALGAVGGLAFSSKQALPPDFVEHVAVTDTEIFFSGPAGDLDGDGDVDILIAEDFSWFESLGGPDPEFVKHSLIGLVLLDKVFFPRLVDVDGDGDVDFSASVPNSGTTLRLSWFRNDGNTPPSFVEVPVDQQPSWSYADGWGGDIDLDGDTDFFVIRREILGCGLCQREIVWLENQAGSYVRHVIDAVLGTNVDRFRLLALDVDADDDPDLVIADRDAETLVWRENQGASFTQVRTIAVQPGGVEEMRPVDVDGDGDVDLVTVANEPGGFDNLFFWYENLGDGTFATYPLDVFQKHLFTDLAVGDFSGDGAPDILLSDFPDAIWLENDGGQPPSFKEHPIAFAKDPKAREVADIDLDGRVDLIRGWLQELVWFENRIGLRLSVTGMGVNGFFCRNRSTGKSVRIRTADTQIDCENEGLVVEPGDELEVFARGRVP